MKKPELLLPVGNPEMFHAAIKGGADASLMPEEEQQTFQ